VSSSDRLNNLNVLSQDLLPTPAEVKSNVVISDCAIDTVLEGRGTLCRILDREDPRLFLVIGPCSIHDVDAAYDYAQRLKVLADKVSDTIVIVMRVYFEKPRTTVGWKGLINDPDLDDSFHIEKGLHLAREFLLKVNELGLPAGTEALDPITPQYLSDLVSWTAIGARTAESQTHREMSSGLSMPVGFKNGTDGSLHVAINALTSVSKPHHFLGINQQGECAVFRTRGNSYGHVVLRGGNRTNYDKESVALCEKSLTDAGMPANIMVDCSHGNSNKDPANQPIVFNDCIDQVVAGNDNIIGMMVESHLEWGNQPLEKDISSLKRGVSITDACIDWETTERELLAAHERLLPVIERRINSKLHN